MIVATLLLLLLAFLAFVVWDRRRLENEKVVPVPREVMDKGFSPSGLAKWKLWAGCSAIPAMLGASQLLDPMKPPFTGRWSWLESLLYFNFGPRGMGTFHCLVALGMLVVGFLAWQREQK